MEVDGSLKSLALQRFALLLIAQFPRVLAKEVKSCLMNVQQQRSLPFKTENKFSRIISKR